MKYQTWNFKFQYLSNKVLKDVTQEIYIPQSFLIEVSFI